MKLSLEERREYKRLLRLSAPQAYRASKKAWEIKNPIKFRNMKHAADARYQKTPNGRIARRKANARYNQSEKYKKCRLKYRYKTTPQEILQMRLRQKNRCAICDQKFIDTPSTDHNHETGAVRGLLCNLCNWGLGHFRDNPKFLASAINYLHLYE